MRANLTTVLLLVSLMQVSAFSFGQRISLSERNAPITRVLTKIKAQTGYDFIFTGSLFKNAKPVSIEVKNAELKEVLKKIFNERDWEYTIEDKSVVISKKNVSFLDKVMDYFSAIDITGRVVDDKGDPLAGASVKVKGTTISTIADGEGRFSLKNVPEDGVLEITSIGFAPKEVKVVKDLADIRMEVSVGKLDEVAVVNTGYQSLPKERATGSFTIIDSALIGRSVSGNVLDRLKNLVPGMYFSGASNTTNLLPSNRVLGLSIRGQSTLSNDVGLDPLIVVDNFPYDGNISNINPNDIESISVLKDAAAASIWGARSGNGVIVITTKKGKAGQRLQIDVNSSVAWGQRPDVFSDQRFINASSYIDVESLLFDRGFFNADLTNTTTRPVVSPVIEILAKKRAGQLSASDAETALNSLRAIDVRNDIQQYIYQASAKQQYHLGLRGGGKNITYATSIGANRNLQELKRNADNRLTINSTTTYTPMKNLEVTTAINYGQSSLAQNNSLGIRGITVGGRYGFVFPYAQLADANGNALAVMRTYRQNFIDSVAKLGFQDWSYKPLEEINNGDKQTKINDLLLRAAVRYKVLASLSVEMHYQNEKQHITSSDHLGLNTYTTRDLINKFSVLNRTTGAFTYPVPLGGILDRQSYVWNTNSVRGQVNFDKTFHTNHSLTGLVGMEIRENTANGYTTKAYGYSDDYGTVSNNLNFSAPLPVNPSGTATIPGLQGGVSGVVNRFISYYANGAYAYRKNYLFSLSARKDGANIFGVRTNDKIVPLWSAGLGWNVSNENFYTLGFLPQLKLRYTYGFNGNVYNGSAYSTGIATTSALTPAKVILNLTPPNPDLSWEKVRNQNIGIDFATKGGVISGSLEYYIKHSQGLLQSDPLAPSTGFNSIIRNGATLKASGFDITLTSRNINRSVKWQSTLLFATLKDKVTAYALRQSASGMIQSTGSTVLGYPLYSIFAYKWAGLDPANGDPQGYLNGVKSKDYTGMINNFNPDSLVYMGSMRPRVFGALRNDVSFHGVSLSVNISYNFGYVVRKPTTSLNYTDILLTDKNTDYEQRWKNPGDEALTNVPSLAYPSNVNRSAYYKSAEVNVVKGDHLRLEDIRLGYTLSKQQWKRSPFANVEFYGYASELGIIWRANKVGLDPTVLDGMNRPRQFALGLRINY